MRCTDKAVERKEEIQNERKKARKRKMKKTAEKENKLKVTKYYHWTLS
jgi:hypothetical protein